MAKAYETGVQSTAKLLDHPLHPMMIPFPIAFLSGALVTDLAYWAVADGFWAHMSLWLILAGLVTGVIAAGLGMVDFVTIRRARVLLAGWIHFLGNGLILLLALWNLLHRWADPPAGVLPLGLALSLVITILLVVTGWVGGELSYRHKIGVIEPEHVAEDRSS